MTSYPSTNLNLRKHIPISNPPPAYTRLAIKWSQRILGGWSELWMLWSPALWVSKVPLHPGNQRTHWLYPAVSSVFGLKMPGQIGELFSFLPSSNGAPKPLPQDRRAECMGQLRGHCSYLDLGRKMAGVGEHHEGLEGPWEPAPRLLQGVRCCLLRPCWALCPPPPLCLSLTLFLLQHSTLM